MKKRTKHQKDEQRTLAAQAFNEGFQMGYQEGYKSAMRELQDDNRTDANRPAYSLPDMS